jgi:Domain of unknown function (DUF4352)
MPRAVIIGGLVLLVLLITVLVWRLQPGQALAVAPGGEIRYGHFGLSVGGVRRASSISGAGGTVNAHGEFVIVTLGVHNRSERGDLTFPPSAGRLIDSDGNVYLPDDAGTAALAAMAFGDAASAADGRRCTGPIRAGDSCTAEVPFDVPPGTRGGMRLEMQFEGPIFVFAEMLLHGRKWMVLPE